MYTFKELRRATKQDAVFLPKLKVALLGDTATQLLAATIKGEGILRNHNIELWEAEYNQVEWQIMGPTSGYYQFEPDCTIIFHSTRRLLERHSFLNSDLQNKLADDRPDLVKLLCKQGTGRVIYYSCPEIEDTIWGSYATKAQSPFTYQLIKLNYELMNISQVYPNFLIYNLAGISAKYGRNFMFGSSVYVNTEIILSLDAFPIISSRTIDIIAAIQGKFKKCLILGLDNAIWGGVVDDDGWENTQVGHGLGIGKTFTEFQEWVKKLKNRGIIVTVCDKNDEGKAKGPFEKNPEMVLKPDDIAVFVANWENKADNIRIIQRTLNIGLDSMVFLDDNPFKRNMVREHVHGATVPELPEDPGDCLEYLYALNLFGTASFSEGDRDRAKQYQIKAKRVSLQQSFTNEAEFLRSLDVVSEVKGLGKFNIPRVARLSQRNNRFNLRIVRYAEAEIAAIKSDLHYATFSFILADRFGNNGLICVIILEKQDTETLFINIWFMSCRVLKRGMENFTPNTLVDYTHNNGFKRIIGGYLPSVKNQMVEEHYPRLGLSETEGGNNAAKYVLDVETYEEKECYITRK